MMKPPFLQAIQPISCIHSTATRTAISDRSVQHLNHKDIEPVTVHILIRFDTFTIYLLYLLLTKCNALQSDCFLPSLERMQFK